MRVVKGANLAMEHVDAELHGWPAAPFATKDETDANYKRMLDVVLDPVNDPAVRVGVASHNLFEVAWAASMAAERGATHRTEFEMLEGMSPAVAEAAADRFGGLLLYAPVVARGELEAAIAYLVRRLDENSGPDNFITHQFSMSPGSAGLGEGAPAIPANSVPSAPSAAGADQPDPGSRRRRMAAGRLVRPGLRQRAGHGLHPGGQPHLGARAPAGRREVRSARVPAGRGRPGGRRGGYRDWNRSQPAGGRVLQVASGGHRRGRGSYRRRQAGGC